MEHGQVENRPRVSFQVQRRSLDGINAATTQNASRNRHRMRPPDINQTEWPLIHSGSSDIPLSEYSDRKQPILRERSWQPKLTNSSVKYISRYSNIIKKQHNFIVARCAKLWNSKLFNRFQKVFGRAPLNASVGGRVIYIDPTRVARLLDERRNGPFIDNLVTSARYTPWDFVPKQLFAQFLKLANFYFLLVAILQLIPNLSTTGHYTTIVPLMIFMSISMAKEGYDDWCRSSADKEENNRTVCRLVSIGNSIDETELKWKNLHVGDIIKLSLNEWVPADILLLSCQNASQVAYVETAALDGETNLKSKISIPEVCSKCKDIELLNTFRSTIISEDPNLDLYSFDGRIKLADGTVCPLSNNQVIYRGSIIRNTSSVFGVVVFSGEESKIRMNANKSPRTKAPHLQFIVNRVVIIIVIFVLFLAIFCTVAYFIWKNSMGKSFYLRNATVPFGPILAGFIILYNTLIPLSLYVSMEIVKLMQMFLMQWDIDMYHYESNTPMEAKTSTINEELGQISHIFTDKTGTLTDNVMLFRKLSVGGQAWIHDLDIQREAKSQSGKLYLRHKKRKPKNESSDVNDHNVELETNSKARWKPSSSADHPQPINNTVDLVHYLRSHPHTLYSRRARMFLVGLGLCHTCLPERTDNGGITYQSASPDELAIVHAASELGYMMIDRQHKSITLRFRSEINADEKVHVYQVLEVIEFSSKRKRMSIIVKLPDGKLCLFCKGADSVIIERLRLKKLARLKSNAIQLRNEHKKSIVGGQVIARRSMSMDVARSQSLTAASFSLNRPQDLDAWLKNRALNARQYVADDENLTGNLISQQEFALPDARHSLAYGETRVPLETDPGDDLLDESIVENDGLMLEKTFQHLQDFATEGLRTLLYGYRIVDGQQFDTWQKLYIEANSSITNRQTKIEAAAEVIEEDLELSGAIAIEDKLQKGVPETIDKLHRANIKIWMLTGDKRETAINVGYSCRLIKHFSVVTILDCENDDLVSKMANLLTTFERGEIAHSVIVIDGTTITQLSEDKILMAMFIDLGVLADSVICCRTSPSQKSLMVHSVRMMVKGTITLAIGDGANDIPMIQEAHVGIGITGKEGLQAARSSDYSIAQFRFLLKLLLVHGRWNYIRMCKYVLGTFYKEVLFYLGQAIFQIFCGWTGTSLYEPWSIAMFNTLFTSLPVICVGMFEKDLTASTLLAVPELYRKGQVDGGFKISIYIGWMFIACCQAFAIFFIAWNTFGYEAQHELGLYPLGTLIFSAVVIVICYKLLLNEMHNKSILAAMGAGISLVVWVIWNIVLSQIYRSNTVYAVNLAFFTRFGREGLWWLSLLLAVFIAITIDLSITALRTIFFPTDADTFQAIEKDRLLRRRLEEDASDELQASWHHGKKRGSAVTLTNGDQRRDDSEPTWASSTGAISAQTGSITLVSTSSEAKAARSSSEDLELAVKMHYKDLKW